MGSIKFSSGLQKMSMHEVNLRIQSQIPEDTDQKKTLYLDTFHTLLDWNLYMYLQCHFKEKFTI